LLGEFGVFLLESGRAADAEEPLLECLRACVRLEKGTPDWRTSVAESRLGQCLRAQGRYMEAESLLAQSQAVLDTVPGVPSETRKAGQAALASLRADKAKMAQR
jgi:hypothetical protein